MAIKKKKEPMTVFEMLATSATKRFKKKQLTKKEITREIEAERKKLNTVLR